MPKKTSIAVSAQTHNKWRQLADEDRRSMSSEFEWLVDQEIARRNRPEFMHGEFDDGQHWQQLGQG